LPERVRAQGYVGEVDLGTGDRASRVFQIVCSPYRNPLGPRERRLVRLTGSRASAWLFSRLARLAGVEPPWARWELRDPRTFENAIGELELDGRSARVTLRRSPREDEGREEHVILHRTSLMVLNGEEQHRPHSEAMTDATRRG
jgi:hypothetical protein